jgi:hypothetical protein
VAPLPLLAQQWAAISCRTTGACRSGLLAHSAARDRVLVPLRLSQSNRHANCKQRYSESLQHGFFLPTLGVEKLYMSHLEEGTAPVITKDRSEHRKTQAQAALIWLKP